MKNLVVTEENWIKYKGRLPDSLSLSFFKMVEVGSDVYFKFVGIGPNSQELCEYDTGKICDIVKEQPGCFLVGSNLREDMHTLVDRFCDLQEEIDESKIEEKES